jgi:hypothetical protein
LAGQSVRCTGLINRPKPEALLTTGLTNEADEYFKVDEFLSKDNDFDGFL